MKLIVDCGATKADWVLPGGKTIRTPGFNLAQTPMDRLVAILQDAAEKLGPGITSVHFYAAALVGEPPVDLGRWFPGAAIEYASDILGAARALFGRDAGIAAIVGTGANTCQYDGSGIARKIDCGGFILGDEGSAAVLGRLFITDYLKGYAPAGLSAAFAKAFQADYPTLVKNVYGAPAPARYLGGFAPFLLSHYDTEDYVKSLVDNNFRAFFERAVCRYDRLPVGIVGGFGYACREILVRIGREYDIEDLTSLASPMEGLVKYHAV